MTFQELAKDEGYENCPRLFNYVSYFDGQAWMVINLLTGKPEDSDSSYYGTQLFCECHMEHIYLTHPKVLIMVNGVLLDDDVVPCEALRTIIATHGTISIIGETHV